MCLTLCILAVYKSEKTQLGAFLETTRSILHTLAGYAEEVEKIIHAKFRNSVDRTPNGTRHITLLYHQVGVNRSYNTSDSNVIRKIVCDRCNPATSLIRSQRAARQP